MTRLTGGLAVLLVLALAGPREAAAQDSGIGAILDWLHKLSGPRFVGAGVTGAHTLAGPTGIRLRLTGAYRVSVSEEGEVVPADANITMITLQPTVEFPIQHIPFDLAVGVALHRFAGDADGFWHYSVPVQAQWRPRGDHRLVPRIGVGLQIFPKFGADDFAPLLVDVSRESAEAVLQIFLGLDYRFR